MLPAENEFKNDPELPTDQPEYLIQDLKRKAKAQKKAEKKLKKAEKKAAEKASKENKRNAAQAPAPLADIPNVQISRKPSWEYLIDVLIVVVGVSISFALNEWRNDRNDTETAVYFHQSIAEDLIADSTILHGQIEFLEIVLNSADSAMNYKGEKIEQKHVNSLLMQFNSSAMPMNDIAFKEMYQSGKADEFIDQSILKDLNRLYNVSYPVAREWQMLEKNSVMNTFLPIINSRFPFAKNYTYTDSTDLQKFSTILLDNEVLNTIQSNGVIKRGLKSQYESTLEEIRFILIKMNKKD